MKKLMVLLQGGVHLFQGGVLAPPLRGGWINPCISGAHAYLPVLDTDDGEHEQQRERHADDSEDDENQAILAPPRVADRTGTRCRHCRVVVEVHATAAWEQ